MNILLTGASGFLGKHIYAHLTSMGCRVTSLGKSSANTLQSDLRYDIPKFNEDFDIVIHAAGKAHNVGKNGYQLADMWAVNVQGTKNLLSALEKPRRTKSIVFISSVAVYGRDSGWLIREEEPLAATEAYGKSKIAAEQLIEYWCVKNDITCSILRPCLIAGVRPPGTLNTMIKGLRKGYYFNIGGGAAKKSMVMADDIARIIPSAAERGGTYNLTDGYHPTLKELSLVISSQLGKNKVRNMPGSLALLLSKTGDYIGERFPVNSDMIRTILRDLTFDDTKAREILGWNPNQVLKTFRVE